MRSPGRPPGRLGPGSGSPEHAAAWRGKLTLRRLAGGLMRPDARHCNAPALSDVQGLLERLKQVKQDSTCSSAGRASHAGCGGPTRGWHALRGRYNLYGAVSARAAQEMAKPKARLA